MQDQNLEQIISVISKGDIRFAEALFDRPGGRKYLQNIVLIIITNLPCRHDEKEELFRAFATTLDNIEYRIKHQKQGEEMLQEVDW